MKRLLSTRYVGAFVALVIGAGVLSASLSSCGVANALLGLSKIQFKLNDVQSVRLAGIDVANKHSVSDFSIMDGVNLLGAFTSGKLPLTFTLNVAAKNPNQPNGTSLSALQVTDFPWRLLINNHETVTGNIGSPVSVPAGGTTTMIPLQVSVDLKEFFADKGYNDLLQIALALAGQGGAGQLQLKATPEMGSPLGRLRYPGELTIVSTQFSN